MVLSLGVFSSETFPQLTILTEDWEPFNYEEEGTVQGISTDMLVLMLQRVGSSQGRSDIEILPWVRALRHLKEKPNTLLYTTTRTEEREHMFKWVGPIFESQFNMYALKSKGIKINTFEDIRNYSVGTLRDDAVENILMFKTGMKLSDFQRVSLNLNNTKKLADGRVDLVPMTFTTLSFTCDEAGLNIDDFEPVFILDKKGMYFAFNLETPNPVILELQKAFDDLKEEGELAAIFSKYDQKISELNP